MDYAPRILIVDDEQSVRTFVEQLFSGDGYSVTTAGTARHAVQILDERNFDLVILDLSLPDRDGLELLRWLRAELPYLKILATSGFMVGDMGDIAMQAGANATLAKPVTAWLLRDTAYRLLEPSENWRGVGK